MARVQRVQHLGDPAIHTLLLPAKPMLSPKLPHRLFMGYERCLMRVINDLAMSGFILTPYISCIRTKRSDVMMIVVTGPMVRIYIYIYARCCKWHMCFGLVLIRFLKRMFPWDAL